MSNLNDQLNEIKARLQKIREKLAQPSPQKTISHSRNTKNDFSTSSNSDDYYQKPRFRKYTRDPKKIERDYLNPKKPQLHISDSSDLSDSDESDSFLESGHSGALNRYPQKYSPKSNISQTRIFSNLQ